MGPREERNHAAALNRWAVFAVLAAIYFFVQFHRVSPAVLSTHLVQAFHASAVELGVLSSMYFYPYAACQPLVGMATERFGGRRVIAAFTFVAALGSVIFTASGGIVAASVGRLILGAGVAGAYVPSVAILSSVFLPKQFGFVNGVLIALGTAGAIGASVPLAAASLQFGWRETLLAVSALTAVLAVLSVTVVPDCGNPVAAGTRPARRSVAGRAGRPTVSAAFTILLRDRRFRIKSALLFAVFGTFITFQGLWSYPLLVNARGMDAIRASKIVMGIGLGFIASSAITGYVSDRMRSRKIPIVILCGLLAATWWALVLQLGTATPKVLAILFVLMGIAAGGINPVVFTMVKELMAEKEIGVGLGVGLINPSAFVGTAACQTLTGWVIGRDAGLRELASVAGYRSAFALCALISSVALALALLLKETFPCAEAGPAREGQEGFARTAAGGTRKG